MISVIVPVYNVKPYLERCLQSIVAQSYRELEILLVDDGSTDGSGEMCEEWAKKDARVRVMHQKNAGLSAARNTGIDAARGEYILLVDSDDYLSFQTAEQLLSAAERTGAEVAVCNYINEFETGELRASLYPELPVNYQFREELLVDGVQYLTMAYDDLTCVGVSAWAKLYRRNCFETLRYPVGRYHEDEFLIYPMMYPRRKIVCIPYVGYHYLRRSGSIMGKGVRYGDMLDMLTERCEFCIARNERLLTERAQSMLTLRLWEAKSVLGAEALKPVRRRRLAIAWKMFKKGWISPYLLVKRAIGCLLG